MKNLTNWVIVLCVILMTGLAFILSGCTISDSDFKTDTDDITAALQNKIMELDAKNKELEKVNGELRVKISILEGEKANLEKSLETLKEEYEYYLSIYNNLDNETKVIIERYEETIKYYTIKIDELENNVENLTKLVSNLEKVIADKDSWIVDLQDEIRRLEIELNKYIELYKKSENDNIEVINGYKKQIAELEKTIENLKKELDAQKHSKIVYIKGKMNGDYRNWIVGNTNINGLDLINGTIEHNGYIFVFIEE